MVDVDGSMPEIEVAPVEGGKAYDEAYVKSLRAEAAAYRVKLREMESQVMRSGIAAKFGLPDALREFLTASDEAGLMAQAEKLAAGVKRSELPAAGGRNPANGGEQAAKADEQEHFEGLRRRVPALMNRIYRS